MTSQVGIAEVWETESQNLSGAGPGPASVRLAPALPQKIPALDGLRGLSILLVLVGHSVNADLYPALYATAGRVGNYGVRMFFVISGFLITTLLLREWDRTGRISLKQFYIRRSLRILPAYVVFVAAILLLNATHIIELLPGDVLHTLTYTVNYHHQRSWYVNHLWSLSVEEQFYLLWPAALLVFKPRRGLRIALAVIAVAPLIRAIMHLVFGASDTALSRHFQAVADALAFGCALAFLYNPLSRSEIYVRATRSVWCLAIPLLCLLLPAAAFRVERALFYVVGVTLAYLGMTLFADHAIRHDGLARRFLEWAVLRWVGLISYSLYLWQELLLDNGSMGLRIAFPQNLLLTFLLATVSYYLVEQRFLGMKERFSYKSRPGNPARPAAVGG